MAGRVPFWVIFSASVGSAGFAGAIWKAASDLDPRFGWPIKICFSLVVFCVQIVMIAPSRFWQRWTLALAMPGAALFGWMVAFAVLTGRGFAPLHRSPEVLGYLGTLAAWFLVLVSAGVALLVGVIVVVPYLLHCVRRRRRGLERVQCHKCGYNLYGLTEPRCPECGTPFDRRFLGWGLPDRRVARSAAQATREPIAGTAGSASGGIRHSVRCIPSRASLGADETRA